MKDWKASARNWMVNNSKFDNSNNQKSNSYGTKPRFDNVAHYQNVAAEIAADFADDKIEKCNLPEERKKRLAIRRSGTAQNPVEKKERQRQRVLPKGRRRQNQRQALLIQNRRRQLLDAIQL